MSVITTAEDRHDVDRWRRHDIVYDPTRQRWGTISETRVEMGTQVALIDWLATVEYSIYTFAMLDVWQKTNEERGVP